MALPISKNMEMVRGDTLREDIVIKDQNGEIFDLTDFDVRMDVKLNKDAPALLSFTEGDGVVVDTPNGIIEINVVSSKTDGIAFSGDVANYVFDLEIKHEVDNRTFTLLSGSFNIYKDVTR